jgi:c-di-GMP-binding flagellar brake protein YcgR
MDSCRIESKQDAGARERRAHLRLRCKGMADVLVLPDGPKIAASLIDISQGGCSIATETEILVRPHTPVEVCLSVRDSKLRLAGEIRYLLDEARAGIQFIEVSSRKKEQIHILMAELVDLEKELLTQIKDASEASSGK